jgi:uncharacterized HhH-GPD family protein
MGPRTNPTPFTGDDDADALLAGNGLALLIGMLLDQQVPMEWAFRGPLELQRRVGGSLDAGTIAAMDPETLKAAFTDKPALHRYPGSMADRVHQLCTYLVEHHGGRAEDVWDGAADAGDAFARIRSLPGYGEQKAKIFLAILGKRLGVAPAGWETHAGDYGLPGHRSIADVDGPGAVEKVRAYKQDVKAKAKAAKAAKATTAKAKAKAG